MDGINVIGFVSANFGLGIAARATVRMLLDQGCPVAIADLKVDAARTSEDHEFDRLFIGADGRLPHSINLFHCNPPSLGSLVRSAPEWLPRQEVFNICVPFWELAVLPEVWRTDLAAMDLVLCPSRFIEQTVRNGCAGPRPFVRHYPHVIRLPALAEMESCAARDRFGLPKSGVLFVQSFEIGSDVERKNPFGAMNAFCRAFSEADEAYLIVKLHNAQGVPGAERDLCLLRDYAKSNKRIIVVDTPLTYREALGLYRACDVYVSLHRSEGLGLGPMEAMLLGKPVIATGWSGNMDFMDDTNACLVGAKLVPVGSPVYRALLKDKTAFWAEPDGLEAARWMRRLYDDPAFRRERGAAAKAAMERREAEISGRDIVETIRALSGTRAEPAPIDPAVFMSSIARMLERKEVHQALSYYSSNRKAVADSPELQRFDELLEGLKRKVG